ncbi:MAG: class I mannose-6-phosphate isomerase [Chloroflexi bacterium]|nr:class I mannose-6-phosphate isomerase [Chloroflexota bacterium]
MSLYPLLLQPVLHTRVWGGRRLETVFHKPLPTTQPYGESWEMHDTATVANGPLAGRTVAEVLKQYGHNLLGPDHDPAVGMPLLVKFLDAADWLSIQVHPNDEQARQLEGEPRGKTEAWYILAVEPGARLVVGVQPGTSRETMVEAIRDNALEGLLVYADVVAGDVLYIPAGTIHALGPGLLIYEIQQSSDLTYRLYDWGRLGLDGQPRPLHVEKGVAVANVDSLPEIKHTAGDGRPIVEIVNSPFFTTWLHQLNLRNGPRITLDTENRCFHILTCIEGAATVAAADVSIELSTGQTALIPASQGAYTLSGMARVLRSFEG